VGHIWRVHVNGTHAKRIASGNDPAVSPDGRWIAFYRGSHLLVIPAEGGKAKRVFGFTAQDLGYRTTPTWAPDSRHLALQTEYDGFVVVDIRSRAAPLRIATPMVGWGSLVSEPSFSPDSRKILYAERRFGDALCSPPIGCSYWSTLSVVSVRTGKRLHLALPPAAHVERGEFSPDSSKIAFIAGNNLWVAALRGGKPLRLTRDHTSSDPVWGKTGIAFLRHKDIWLTDDTGRHLRQLTQSRADIRPAFFSADGRELIGWRAPFQSCGGPVCQASLT
jgi:Tol biopolymer transport system component